MKIWHRVSFGKMDAVNSVIEALGIKYKKTPGPHGYYIITFEIEESDPRWPQVAELIRQKNAPDFFDTVFTTEEILGAEWVRLIPIFEQGYPQPEATWVRNPINYEGKCPHCGAGYRQVAPFRLAREPRMGKHDFLTLHWGYALFCTHRVLEALQAHEIKGYEAWEAILHGTGESSKVVSQLVFPHIARPGLLDTEELTSETCQECGVTKYSYHRRGYMCFRRGALPKDVDFVQTHEWFGAGGRSAHREILISHRVAKLILQRGWQGVRLKPLRLVE